MATTSMSPVGLFIELEQQFRKLQKDSTLPRAFFIMAGLAQLNLMKKLPDDVRERALSLTSQIMTYYSKHLS